MTKRYDQAYFDHWYRSARYRVKSPLVLERKVRMTVAVAEYYLGHPVRSVLDVGCGEGAWRAPLLALRPKLDYRGVDASEYAVRRYGRSRNLRYVRFGQLAEQRFGAPVDLLVCSDVMHYLESAEVLRGLSGFTSLCDGVGFFELFCKGDAFVGDKHNFVPRTERWYRRAFAETGWTHCGSHCYLGPRLREEASKMEINP
jgi:SAM-dependent methyltransferase